MGHIADHLKIVPDGLCLFAILIDDGDGWIVYDHRLTAAQAVGTMYKLAWGKPSAEIICGRS